MGAVEQRISDISETPDVAVWAKSIQAKGALDKQGRISGISSITLHYEDNGREHMIDPANRNEVESAARFGLTDKAKV